MNPEIGLVPVPLVLDLWSIGHSALDISEKLGLPNGRHVARIIKHARSIGDSRAVFHMDRTRLLLGKGISPAERKVAPAPEGVPRFPDRAGDLADATRPARNGHERPSGHALAASARTRGASAGTPLGAGARRFGRRSKS